MIFFHQLAFQILSVHLFSGGRLFHQQVQRISSLKMARNTFHLSPLAQSMEYSKILEIHNLAKEIEKRGEKVYSLAVGEPDYAPPSIVIDATVS